MKRIYLSLLALLIGCGDGADIGSTNPGSHTQAEEIAYPTLGEYQLLDIQASEQMRPIGGGEDEWETLRTHIVGLVHVIKQGDDKPELSFQPCTIELPPVDGIQPALPDSTVQAAAPQKVVAQWSKVDDHFELTTPEWSSVVFGATLANALTDALPTNKNDARVVDLDGDNKPGVTMKASIGRLYMVMRGQMKLHGTYTDAGLSGDAEYKRDFYIFGDNVFGIAKNKVDSVYANSESRPAPTTGTMVPTSARACADL